MDDSIHKRLMRIRQHDTAALQSLVEQFSPLLKKYAYKLRTEDAFYDLQADFIEMLATFDVKKLHNTENQVLTSYFDRAVYTDYIRLSRRDRQYTQVHWLECDMSPDDKDLADKRAMVYEQYDALLIYDLKRWLTDAEFEIVFLLYFLSVTVHEIAFAKHISSQAVNKTKNRALYKIKMRMEGGQNEWALS